jgi:hypothetical protein
MFGIIELFGLRSINISINIEINFNALKLIIKKAAMKAASLE